MRTNLQELARMGTTEPADSLAELRATLPPRLSDAERVRLEAALVAGARQGIALAADIAARIAADYRREAAEQILRRDGAHDEMERRQCEYERVSALIAAGALDVTALELGHARGALAHAIDVPRQREREIEAVERLAAGVVEGWGDER